jgi:hypothetical protein
MAKNAEILTGHWAVEGRNNKFRRKMRTDDCIRAASAKVKDFCYKCNKFFSVLTKSSALPTAVFYSYINNFKPTICFQYLGFNSHVHIIRYQITVGLSRLRRSYLY